MKQLLCASLSAALCVSGAAPALAYDHGFADAYARRDSAAVATAGFRIPLGATRKAEKPSFGLGFNYGQSVAPPGVEQQRPAIKLADIRFTDEGVSEARLAGFNFAQKDGEIAGDRLNAMEGKDSTTWIIIGLVVAGAVVWAVTDDDDDDD